MIEFLKINSGQQDKSKIKNRKRTGALSPGESRFSSDLASSISYSFEGTFDELMDNLKDHEKKFIDSQTLYDLNRYKSVVSKILKLIQEQSMSTRTLKRARMSNKEDFTIIEIINQKLLDLTSEITRRSQGFNIMKTMEEIRGLLFDLLY